VNKQRVLIFIVVFFLALDIIKPLASALESKSQLIFKPGISISNIDFLTFTTKFKELHVSNVFISNPDSLVDLEYNSKSQNARVFINVDLFTYSLETPLKASKEDLVKYYNSENLDNLEKEKIFSVLASLYEKNNTPILDFKKSEPKVQVSYTYESTKEGYIAIPHRKIVFTDNITTLFYVYPLKLSDRNDLSYFNFALSYYIEPALFASKVASSKYRNPYLDFDGFNIPVPSKVDDQYSKIIQNTIKELKKYLDGKNKFISVSNITSSNIDAVKDVADVFLVPVSNDTIKDLESIRKIIPDKIIIASFSGYLSDDVLEAFLNECLFTNSIPQFERNEKSSEFFYYENDFKNFTPQIARYITYYDIASSLELVRSETFTNFRVNTFKSNESVIRLVFLGDNSEIAYRISKSSLPNKVSFRPFNLDNFTYIDENDFLTLSFRSQDVSIIDFVTSGLFVLGKTLAPSSKGIISVYLVNGTNKFIEKKAFASKDSFKREISIDFKPFETKPYDLYPNEGLSIDGVSVSNKPTKVSDIYTVLMFIILFALMLFFLFKQISLPLLNIKENALLLLLILITILLWFFNVSQIGLNLTAVFILLAFLSFVVLSFIEGNSRILAFSLYLLTIFFIYNLLEFHSLLPILKFQVYANSLFEVIFFYTPFVLTIVFFFTFKKGITKLETFLVFLILLVLISFKGSLSLIENRIFMYNYVPLFLILLMLAIVGLKLNKNSWSKHFTYLALLTFLVIITLLLNTIFINNILSFNSNYNNILWFVSSLPLAIFYPVFFVFLYGLSKIKNYTIDKLNKYVFTLVNIFVLNAVVFFGIYMYFGNPLSITLINFIEFIPIFLFVMLFFET